MRPPRVIRDARRAGDRRRGGVAGPGAVVDRAVQTSPSRVGSIPARPLAPNRVCPNAADGTRGHEIAVAGSLLLVGCTLMVLSDATWGLALGVASLLGFLATASAPLADPPEPDDASAPADAVLEREA